MEADAARSGAEPYRPGLTEQLLEESTRLKRESRELLDQLDTMLENGRRTRERGRRPLPRS